jgi:enoyl-CoA hydratase/carnithine racemase
VSYEDLLVSRSDEGVGSIAINRPEVHNSVRAGTMDEIARAVSELTDDCGVRAIVLTSTGKHLCSGAEFSFLKELSQTPSLQVKDKVYKSFQGAARALYHCPKPTLAAFSGAAVTVGCELAIACDFRLISENAFFQESWIKVGILPPLGGMMLLPRLVGLSAANDMILRGRAVKADEALRLGLAHEVVPAEQFEARRREFAVELAALPPQAYAAAKQGIHRGLESTMEKEWAANVLAQSLLLGSDDFKEGLDAVMSRRAPVFGGS